MLKRIKNIDEINKSIPRDGNGLIVNKIIFSNEELENQMKGYHINELEPNSSIGYHEHHGEDEIYHILNGKGIVNDNGTEYEVQAGNVIYTKSGTGHALKNIGDELLTFIAFIIKK